MLAKHKGFSLIELMTTVSLIAIAASLAIPSIVTLTQDNRLTQAANDFIAAISLARSEAVMRNRRVDLKPLTGSNWANGWLIEQTSDAGNSIAEFEALENQTMTSVEGVSAIQFQNVGMRVNVVPLTFWLCDSRGEGRRIEVNAAGTARIPSATQDNSGC